MEPKHIAIGGVLILILLGLLWLAKLLPGLGFGLGGGKGEGGGPGEGSAAEVQKATPPPVGAEEEVLVSQDKATLKSTKAAVTPQQIADWAKADRKFIIRDLGDAQVKIMQAFRDAAKQSEGRIIVKE